MAYKIDSNTSGSIAYEGYKKKKDKKENNSWMSKLFNVLDIGSKATGSAIRYGMEEMTGKDFYKEGDFGKVIGGQRTESFMDSFNRVYKPESIGAKATSTIIGMGLDIATDPLTWLGGIGLLKRGKDTVKLATSINKFKSAEKAIVTAQKFGKSAKAVDGMKDLRNTFTATEKAMKEMAEKSFKEIKKKSWSNKALLGASYLDMTMTGLMIGEGVNQMVTGKTGSEKFMGVVFAGMGSVGMRTTLRRGKFLTSLTGAKTADEYLHSAKTYLSGGGNRIASESMNNADNVAKVQMEKFGQPLERFIKSGKLDVEDVMQKDRLSRYLESGDSNFAKSKTELDSFKHFEALHSKFQEHAVDVLQKAGKDTLEIKNYMKVLLKDEKTGMPPTEEQLAMLGDLSSIGSITRKGKHRKYETADLRDASERMKKAGLVTNRDPYQAFYEQYTVIDRISRTNARVDDLIKNADMPDTGAKTWYDKSIFKGIQEKTKETLSKVDKMFKDDKFITRQNVKDEAQIRRRG